MEYPKRKQMRLPDYDYSQNGGYFVTICTHEKRCILSRVIPGDELQRARIVLTPLGRIVESVLQEQTAKNSIYLDAWTIMPNHIHMLIRIEKGMTSMPIGRLVGALKSISANHWMKECNERGIVMGKLWQRDFYDHVIRNGVDYMEKLKYIDENPDKWTIDDLYSMK